MRETAAVRSATATRRIKILFLAANPLDTTPLLLDEEIRAIDEALQKGKFRDLFDVKQHWAVRSNELQEFLLRHQPDIVHFSGHGSSVGELLLKDDTGHSHPVSSRALSNLFRILKGNIRCVVLNARYSEVQAQAIAEHIDAVVGMTKAVGDKAATNFAAGFYLGLGYGRDLATAFQLGCSRIDLANLNEQDTPKLLAPNGDPSKIVFATAEAQQQPSATSRDSKYNVHFAGDVQGVVAGENAQVTMNFGSGAQQPPSLPSTPTTDTTGK